VEPDVLKLLGAGGFAVALLYLLYLVGMRLVAAIDRVATKQDDHTKADLASHAEMRTDIAALHGKLDGMLELGERLTPPPMEIPRIEEQQQGRRTPIGGVPIGQYSFQRPGTKGGR
jgi:hypothetical protein